MLPSGSRHAFVWLGWVSLSNLGAGERCSDSSGIIYLNNFNPSEGLQVEYLFLICSCFHVDIASFSVAAVTVLWGLYNLREQLACLLLSVAIVNLTWEGCPVAEPCHMVRFLAHSKYLERLKQRKQKSKNSCALSFMRNTTAICIGRCPYCSMIYNNSAHPMGSMNWDAWPQVCGGAEWILSARGSKELDHGICHQASRIHLPRHRCVCV